MTQAKRIRNFLKDHEIKSQYTLEEAISLIKEYSNKASVKFPESVDAHVILGVDPTKGDQVVKSTVSFQGQAQKQDSYRNSALARVRGGGTVAPKKKGALANPFKSGGGSSVTGSGNRQIFA